MKNRHLYYFNCLCLLVVWLLSACSQNRFDISVEQTVKLNVYRIDTLFFEPQVEQAVERATTFYEQFPEFADIYFRQILNIGGLEARYFNDYFSLFLSNPDFRESYDSTKVVFGDFEKQTKAIELAFDYLKHYLPDLKIPSIYTMISGFNESVVLFDNSVAVSFDKFLGSNSIFYKKLASPQYLLKRYNTDLLPVEVVRSWLESEYPYNALERSLANTMIYYGKIMYLMDAAFPTSPDNFKISYLPEEITWAKSSEKHVWSYFIDKKLLFTSDDKTIKKYIGEAPFIQDFGENSPGRFGIWMGWQIVRSYMNKNTDVSIEELLKMTDYRHILLESGYAPH